MSKNLLNGVNDVLQKVQIVRSNHLLTTLTNSQWQIFIDNAISSWNEAIDQIYSKSDIMRPKQADEDTITLQTNVRSYSLPCDLVQIRWPLQDETNGNFINKYPGGYEELRHSLIQPENYTGQPVTGVIDPIEGELYIDMLPTSTENGDVYRFVYWKDTGMARSSDIFPFSDVVYRALTPFVAELWRYNQNQQTSEKVKKESFGRAVRALKQEPRESSYIKRFGSVTVTTPLGYDPYNVG